MDRLVNYDVFNLAFVKPTENVDYSITGVENPVNRGEFKDKLQWASYWCSQGYPLSGSRGTS